MAGISQAGEGVENIQPEAESLLRTVFENAPGGIIVCDEQARVTMTNPTADTLYNQQEPSGLAVESRFRSLCVYRPDGVLCDPSELPLSRSALQGESCQQEEYLFKYPDGRLRWIMVNSKPIMREDGKPSGAVAVFQDITPTKELQQALQESKNQLRWRNDILEGINRIFHDVLNFETEGELGSVCLDVAEQVTQSAFGFIGKLSPSGHLEDIAVSDSAQK
ncbi:MAG: PAS domain-containing protein, partial [Desulfohalobiaceae bacterium]|nr:PAS domain-containing protein [Desulfohalobiaceae bacterium]